MPRKRVSRSIWDKAREPAAPVTAIICAVLYELQPMDLTQLEFSIDDLRHHSATACRQAGRFLLSCTQSIAAFLYQRSLKEWGCAMLMLLYWRIVVYLHRTLNAGPMVLILTALALIFTIGLGDRHQDGGTLSAYSVFNAGFQSMLGGIDADQLLAQHVGGGLPANIGGGANQNANAGHHRNEIHDRREARRAQELPPEEQQQQGEPQLAQGQLDQEQEQVPPPQQGRSRMSNKKQRRNRNIQQRREIQQQRQAAREMGFGENDINQDQMAMNHLIEDQIQEI